MLIIQVNLLYIALVTNGNNDVPPNYIDCIKEYGAWQQRHIVDIYGGKNPYKLDNGLFVNDGDIREVK